MNNLLIPPSANWYEPNILACAPDNTLIYGAKNMIVVINPTADNLPANIRVIHRAHDSKVISVNINKNWGTPKKLAVSTSEDNTVKLWDLNTYEKILSHKEHVSNKKLVSAAFAGEDRVISCSEHGQVIIWNITLNTINTIKHLLGSKDTITCMSSCPHASWLTAFGLKNGLVVVCDLRKEGKVLFRLRGHEKEVVSLSWCPAPVNVFPANPSNIVGNKKPENIEPVENEESAMYMKRPGVCIKINVDKIDSKKTIEIEETGRGENTEEAKVKPKVDKKGNNKLDDEMNIIIESTNDLALDNTKEIEVQEVELDGVKLSCSRIVPDHSKKKSTKPKKDNPWVGLKHADDDEVPPDFAEAGREKPVVYGGGDNDFLADCMKLKRTILGEDTPSKDKNFTPKREKIKDVEPRLILKGKRKENKAKENVVVDDINKIEDLKLEESSSQTSDLKLEAHQTKVTGKLKESSKDKTSEPEPKETCKVSKDKTTSKIISLENYVDLTVLEEEMFKDAEECDENLSEEISVAEANSIKSSSKDEICAVEVKSIAFSSKDKDVEEIPSQSIESQVPAITIVASKSKGSEAEAMVLEETKETHNVASKSKEPDTTDSEAVVLEKTKEADNIVSTSNKSDRTDSEEMVLEETKGDNVASTSQESDKTVSEAMILGKTKEADKVTSTSGENSMGKTDIKVSLLKGNSKNVLKTERFIPIEEPVKEEPRKEFLLASSAKEGNIYIWRAGSDGRMQTFLQLPNAKGKPGRNAKHVSNDKIWITLCWVSPTTLLCSSKTGELLSFSLPKPKDKNKQFRLIHNDHGNTLFGITGPIEVTTAYNWKNDVGKNAWTVGQDRLLINTGLGPERKTFSCYPTVCGTFTCMAPAVVDPSRVAIGNGEGVIRIWDMSRPHLKIVFMANFYSKLHSKVSSLAWHPEKEFILACSTMEGRIAFLDVSKPSKAPVLLCDFFKTHVFKIEFGPYPGENSNEYGIYAASEGKLVIFNMNKKDREPLEIDTPDNTFVYMFSWKPDFKRLIVTTKLNTLLVYDGHLNMQSTHYIHKKLNLIQWHPNAVSDDTKYSNYFACGNSTKDVMIYELKSECGVPKCNLVATLVGHTDVVEGIAWNPHNESQFVSVASDGAAQVWDVDTQTILATYINRSLDALSTVMWSPLDPNFIITGSRDSKLEIWNLSENEPKPIEKIAELHKNIVKENNFETKSEEKSKSSKSKKSTKNVLLPIFHNAKSLETHVSDIRTLKEYLENKDKEHQVEESQEVHDIIKIFGDKNDMIEILDKNLAAHKQKGKHSLYNMLGLFKGDLNMAVKNAIDEKRVTPWIISVAPMVSPKVWQEACEVYTEQLLDEAESDPMEIVTYLLTIHKVEKAISVLCENQLYREALALAKARLGDNDEIITDIIEKWAKNSVFTGNFELAAQCYVFLGKYEEAASILFRRQDLTSLRLAQELAEKTSNQDLLSAIKTEYNILLLKKQEDSSTDTETSDMSNKSSENLDLVHGNGEPSRGVNKNREKREDITENSRDIKENIEVVKINREDMEDMKKNGKDINENKKDLKENRNVGEKKNEDVEENREDFQEKNDVEDTLSSEVTKITYGIEKMAGLIKDVKTNLCDMVSDKGTDKEGNKISEVSSEIVHDDDDLD